MEVLKPNRKFSSSAAFKKKILKNIVRSIAYIHSAFEANLQNVVATMTFSAKNENQNSAKTSTSILSKKEDDRQT